MAQLLHKVRFRTALAWLTVLTMLFALFPGLPVRTDAATGDPVTLSQSIFTVGYADTTVTLTGSDNFPFKSDTKLTLYSTSGKDMGAISNMQVQDTQHLKFTLKAGVQEGKYNLYVTSYGIVATTISVLSSFDPTNIRVTPGVNRDIRFDWVDPSGSNFQYITIYYGPITQQYYTGSYRAYPGQQNFIMQNLLNNTAYRFMITTRKADGSETTGVTLDNGGKGYTAIDSTPPGDLTQIKVTSVPNGFALTWTDPVDADLNLITVQVAEHGTTQWSNGSVVQKGTQKVTLTPLNTSKRYDLRFTKADTNGNLSYQVDNHGGYGYTVDTTSPFEVNLQQTSPLSDNSASLSWYDPDNDDFHHVNIYLRSDLSDWKYIGRVNKGVEAYTLIGLAQNINYEVRVAAVDDKGNESEGVTNTFTIGNNVDTTALTNVTIAQEPQGGLKLSWDSDTISTVNFSKFKMYYAPIGSTDVKDYKSTAFTGKTATSAFLRSMPRGTYKLQMRLFDSYGIEQTIGTYTNTGDVGYYVSGLGGLNGPSELAAVHILPTPSQNLMITWDAASTDGTSVLVYYAAQSETPVWTLAGKVDKRLQQYTVNGLRTDLNYFFKLIVVNDADNSQSAGAIYNNSGYGFNVLGGDTHAPGEVTNAAATVSYNSIIVTYTEPTDSDFDSVKIYVSKKDTSEAVNTYYAQRDDGGATISNLLPNIAYTLKITTVDTYGNESDGILLDNAGQGYLVSGNGASPNEVQNALLVPSTTQMTVRFQDPQANDYDHANIKIKDADATSYTISQTVYKGQNEVTFYGLAPNQQYVVHISTFTSSGKESTGIDLGGTTGVPMLPIPEPNNVIVTPGNHSLGVSWQSPLNTQPTSYQVQVMESNSSKWSDPMIVTPATTKVVFHGLENNQIYRVRVSTIVNGTSSQGVQPGNIWSGFTPRATSIAPSPSVIQHGTGTQTLSILGTNTRFSYGTAATTVQLFDSNNQDISSNLSGLNVVNQNRVDVGVDATLAAGTYKLVLHDPEDGELVTYVKVQSLAPAVTLTASDVTTADYGYTSFTMNLTGEGFTNDSTVVIDGLKSVTAWKQDNKHLYFSMPTGLLP
ncbi:MAG: fibronectin type III domain-containing protein, partial [Tumebacillaceae bacterium]